MTTLQHLIEATNPDFASLVWDPDAGGWITAANDGTAVWVVPLIYTSAIITGPIGSAEYVDRWCYESPVDALAAARAWGGPWNGGEPTGWHRHPGTGRRRTGGDPSTEHINP